MSADISIPNRTTYKKSHKPIPCLSAARLSRVTGMKPGVRPTPVGPHWPGRSATACHPPAICVYVCFCTYDIYKEIGINRYVIQNIYIRVCSICTHTLNLNASATVQWETAAFSDSHLPQVSKFNTICLARHHTAESVSSSVSGRVATAEADSHPRGTG